MSGILDEEGEEWLPALDAAQLVARRFGGLTAAKHAIAEGLREGLLSAAAEGCQIFEGEEATEPEEYEGTIDQLLDVPGDVFSRSVSWESDRLGWDWELGAFDVFTEDSSYAYIGVHFVRSEIEKIDPSQAPYVSIASPGAVLSPSSKNAQRERTATARYWDWEPAFADLVALADFDSLEEQFGPLRRGFQAKLETWFIKRMEEDDGAAPSENECRLRARRVLHAVARLRAQRQNS